MPKQPAVTLGSGLKWPQKIFFQLELRLNFVWYTSREFPAMGVGDQTKKGFIMNSKLLSIVVAATLATGCMSQLTVKSGGSTASGHCNYHECSLGSLYGIDWCGKDNGVLSQEPMLPFARVTSVVRPQDFALAFFSLGLVIPIHIEYDIETKPLPCKGGSK